MVLGVVNHNILLNTLLSLEDDEKASSLVEKIPAEIIEVHKPYLKENKHKIKLSITSPDTFITSSPTDKFTRSEWVHQVMTYQNYQWNDIDEKILNSQNPEYEWIWEELIATNAHYNIIALPKRFLNLEFLVRAYIKYLSTFNNCAWKYDTPYVLDFLRHVCKRNDVDNDLVVMIANAVLIDRETSSFWKSEISQKNDEDGNLVDYLCFPDFAYCEEHYYKGLYKVIDILSSSRSEYEFIKDGYDKFMKRFL